MNRVQLSIPRKQHSNFLAGKSCLVMATVPMVISDCKHTYMIRWTPFTPDSRAEQGPQLPLYYHFSVIIPLEEC
jgi:hypothetical protein